MAPQNRRAKRNQGSTAETSNEESNKNKGYHNMQMMNKKKINCNNKKTMHGVHKLVQA